MDLFDGDAFAIIVEHLQNVSFLNCTGTGKIQFPARKTVAMSDNGESHDEEAAISSPTLYPTAFYCPTTKQLLSDPVVLADGISYERSAIASDSSSGQPYPNRALKVIMEERIQLQRNNAQQPLRSPSKDTSVPSTITPTTNSSDDSVSINITNQHQPLSNAFYCLITLELMQDPVIDPEGNTYERLAIENWIGEHRSSPTTRKEMSIDQLYPNRAVRDLLQEETNKSDHLMHPAIRKWKEASLALPVASGALETEAATQHTDDEEEEERQQLIWRRQNMRCLLVLLVCSLLALCFSVVFGANWLVFPVVLGAFGSGCWSASRYDYT